MADAMREPAKTLRLPALSRGLDFIVCGVPRSGTSATVQYLNACTGLRCFSELFHENADHAAIRLPEGLAAMAGDADIPANKAEQARHWLDRYDTEIAPSLVGNKMPAYYLFLGRVLDALSTGRAIVCLRDIAGIMGSYNARARRGTEWHAGRTGMFAGGEQLVLLKALLHARDRDLLLLPHAALLHDPQATTEAMVAFLSAGTERAMRIHEDQVEGVRAQGAEKRAAHTPLNATEEQVAALFQTDGLQALFASPRPIHIRDLPAPAAAEMAALPSDVVGYLEPFATGSEHIPNRHFWPAFCESMAAGELNPRAL
ncbi:MAG: sulfotransferase [Pseudomonadota bacterium]